MTNSIQPGSDPPVLKTLSSSLNLQDKIVSFFKKTFDVSSKLTTGKGLKINAVTETAENCFEQALVITEIAESFLKIRKKEEGNLAQRWMKKSAVLFPASLAFVDVSMKNLYSLSKLCKLSLPMGWEILKKGIPGAQVIQVGIFTSRKIYHFKKTLDKYRETNSETEITTKRIKQKKKIQNKLKEVIQSIATLSIVIYKTLVPAHGLILNLASYGLAILSTKQTLKKFGTKLAENKMSTAEKVASVALIFFSLSILITGSILQLTLPPLLVGVAILTSLIANECLLMYKRRVERFVSSLG